MNLQTEEKGYLRLAIKTALENIDEGGGPFGAVVVRDKEIIGRSGNRVVVNNDPTAHAEIEAIRQAAAAVSTHDLSDCVIYSSCEPCPMCLGAIYWSGIKRVVFASDRYRAAVSGFSDEMIYEEIMLPPGERKIEMISELTGEGEDVFRKWDLFPGKVLY